MAAIVNDLSEYLKTSPYIDWKHELVLDRAASRFALAQQMPVFSRSTSDAETVTLLSCASHEWLISSLTKR